MRRTQMMCRLTLAGGAILLALTGCSGGSNANNAAARSSAAQTSASSAAATTSSSSAPAPAGDAAFCGQAQGFVNQVEAAVQSGQQTSFAQKLPTLVSSLQAITPPAPIAADWQTAVSALQQLAADFQGVNLSDPQQLQQLSQKIAPIETQLGAASQHIEDYLKTQCGITAGSTG